MLVLKPGDDIVVLPSGLKSKIKSIETMNEKLEEAFPPMAVAIQLEDEIDISRGDMLASPGEVMPKIAQEIDTMVCWMNQKPLQVGAKYHLRHTTNDVKCIVTKVDYKVDINSFETHPDDLEVGLNDIARVTIRTTKPLVFDDYKRNRITGSVILVDEGSNETVAAGMLLC